MSVNLKSNRKSAKLKSKRMSANIRSKRMSANNTAVAFIWTISNFSQIHYDEHRSLTSPAFKICDSDEETYTLELFSEGDSVDPNSMSCYLHRTAGKMKSTLDYTFHLIDPAGKKLIFEKITKTFNENDSGRCPLILISELKNEMKRWPADVLIVRCIIVTKKRNKILPSNVLHIKANSTMSIDRKFFIWSVAKPDNSHWRKQTTFHCTEKNSFEVILTTNCKHDILIFIKNASDECSYFCVNATINLMSAEDVVQDSLSDRHVFEKSDQKNLWRFPTFFTKKTLREKKCIDKGHFTISIEFVIPNGNVIHEIESNAIPQTSATQHPLHNDIRQLLSANSDVILKADGVPFHAHKCLLSSRSPVFEDILANVSQENQTEEIVINDMDSATLKRLLKFMYSETIDEIDYDNTLKLIIAADRYQVEALADECVHILMSFLSLENALDIYTIADMIDHKELKASVINLLEKHAEYILSSSEWKVWSKQNVKLGLEISSSVALHLAKRPKYEE